MILPIIVTCYCSMFYVSVCPSVTLVHPVKAIGRNNMPLGRDTRVVPSNIVLDRGPSPVTGREDLLSEPQFIVILPIT